MTNTVERVSLIIRSSIDELISKFEDPAKLISQAIVDEKCKYAKLLDQASETFGNEKKAKQDYDKAVEKAKQEHELAVKALKAGNEDDAKLLLVKEQEFKKEAETLKVSYDAIKKSADIIRNTLDTYRKNIKEMESKEKEIKAKATATKSINQANSIAQAKVDITINDNFKRLQEKADKDYNTAIGKAEYINELPVEDSVEAKYLDDDGDDADVLLAGLKAEVGEKKE